MYLWLKAFHLLAVISWMAGMLYLPRLMVYHAAVPAESETASTFKVMERRLLLAIMTPAMIATLGLGAWLVVAAGYAEQGPPGWLIGKLILVAGMVAVHGLLAHHVRQFGRGGNRHSPRYFRILNEIPTALLIGIVFLVVLQPG